MALCIKSSVDLKELEKFGFEYKHSYYVCCSEYGDISIIIYANREINVITSHKLNILYDLIKADLVVKVEENK